ncbi:MAG: hypothetical protein AABW84_01605 [Nanoarchaeota archaeon]
MITEHKKEYMRKYNKQLEVKVKKAAYMRKVRAERKTKDAYDMVRFLLNAGYENMAFDYAKQYVPDMLVTIKSPTRTRKLK